jgi:hypothetical protein
MEGNRVRDGGIAWQRCQFRLQQNPQAYLALTMAKYQSSASRLVENLSGGFTVCSFRIWVAFSAYCVRRMAWEGGETEHRWTVYIQQRGNYRHEVIYRVIKDTSTYKIYIS